MFRVVADQLKISEGWVRCGHCSDVFDATLYLEAWGGAKSAASDASLAPRPSAAQVAQVAPAAAVSAASTVTHADAGEPIGAELAEGVANIDLAEPRDGSLVEAARAIEAPDEVEQGLAASSPVHEADIETLPPPLDEPEGAGVGLMPSMAEPDFQAELLRFAGEQGRVSPASSVTKANTEAPMAAPMAEALSTHEPLPAPATSAAGLPSAPTGKHEVPGFVRQARRRAFWQSTSVRLALHGVVATLSVLLALQWAVHERDWLAARQPALKPWLVRLCEPLQCAVKPLRRIESVVIDSSELVRRLGNFHSFDFALKNTSDVALAMPALELTLTDASDTAIARRVFLPDEWPSAPSELAAGGSASVSLRLTITVDGPHAMAGYRALVFYP